MQGVTIGEEFVTGPNVTADAQLGHYTRESTLQLYHASFTCNVGMRDDTLAVVDSYGRVFGVNSLGVVDISAIPLLHPGHAQATTYKPAEKITNDIRN